MNDVEARAQALLEVARHAHDPTPDDRQRLRVSLAAALGPASAAGTGSALAGPLSHAAQAPTSPRP